MPRLVTHDSGGDITVNIAENPVLETITFSAMVQANPIAITQNAKLRSITFSALTKLAAPLDIANNPRLTQISFPHVTDAIGGINIYSNALLASVAFPKLTSACGLAITQNPKLVTLDFGSITKIGSETLSMYGNGPGLVCSALKTACGQGDCGSQHSAARYCEIYTNPNGKDGKDSGKCYAGPKLTTC